MLLGYNTNGLAHHDLFDAVELLAEIGYRSVAVTIDHGALAPGDRRTPAQLRRLRQFLEAHRMRSVVETGARFLLDLRKKHEPTLLTADAAERRRRIAFYQHAVRCAAELRSDCVSLWSGVLHDGGDRQGAMSRLIDGLRQVLDDAAAHGVAIGFEPEPGMLIGSMTDFEELLARIDAPNLKLTLDIGHLHCQGEVPIAEQVRRWASRLVNVHLEDMRAGVHQHLMFGEGEILFPPILKALASIGYRGGVHVELSRHSHEGPSAARKACEFLRPLFGCATAHQPEASARRPP